VKVNNCYGIDDFNFLLTFQFKFMNETMRNFFLVAILLLSVFACRQNQAGTSSGPVIVEFSITGMSCMGCVETVRSSIAQIEGVDTVVVSLDQANALVTFKPQKTDTLCIRKAVELNGYKVKGARKVVTE
jgi:copper chaperone CopZ